MSLSPVPFKVHISDVALEKLNAQLKISHIAKPTYENSSAPKSDYGMKREWLIKAKARWEDGFDW